MLPSTKKILITKDKTGNVTSLIQPMNQCIIASFKKNIYKKSLLHKVVSYVDSEMNPNPTEFIKNFKLINAMKEIRDAWKRVTVASLAQGWKNIFKHIEWKGNDGEVQMESFDEEVELEEEVVNGEKFMKTSRVWGCAGRRN